MIDIRRKHLEREINTVSSFFFQDYCVTLSKQLSGSGLRRGFVGKEMDPAVLDKFADEQLHQLLELKVR